MEKGGCVRVIEGEEVRRNEPIEYFLPTGVNGRMGDKKFEDEGGVREQR